MQTDDEKGDKFYFSQPQGSWCGVLGSIQNSVHHPTPTAARIYRGKAAGKVKLDTCHSPKIYKIPTGLPQLPQDMDIRDYF